MLPGFLLFSQEEQICIQNFLEQYPDLMTCSICEILDNVIKQNTDTPEKNCFFYMAGLAQLAKIKPQSKGLKIHSAQRFA